MTCVGPTLVGSLHLDLRAVLELLLLLGEVGEYVSPSVTTLSEIPSTDFPDMDDAPFYAAALAAPCALVTGNLKHYPRHGPVSVLSPSVFLGRFKPSRNT